MGRTVVIGTRGSDLARAQASIVASLLKPSRVQIRIISTHGDRTTDTPSGDGIFVKEIQRALLDREIDLAVHSLKDVPTEPVDGLVLAAVPVREDPRECVVGAPLRHLPPGARVGTGSPRRVAQMHAMRPDLEAVVIRGNVPTRIRLVRENAVDAALLARAGLARLGLLAEAAETLAIEDFLPAPGQAALAIEARADDDAARALCAAIDDAATRVAVETERAVLRALGGGCMLPVAAYAVVENAVVWIDARVVAADGAREARVRDAAPIADAAALAIRVARALERDGARGLL